MATSSSSRSSRFGALATFAPLTPVELGIMLALANRDEHAYALMVRIEADSMGETMVPRSSIKTALPRLRDRGWIERRGRLYCLTDAGWHRLTQERRRLSQNLRLLDNRLAAHERLAHPGIFI